MRHGQSTLEYVFLIALVAAAIIAISVYVSRGFQGRLREQADQVGEQYSLGGMDTKMVTTSNFYLNQPTLIENEDAKTSTSTRTTAAIVTVNGTENVVRPLNEEHWDNSW